MLRNYYFFYNFVPGSEKLILNRLGDGRVYGHPLQVKTTYNIKILLFYESNRSDG